MKKLFFIISVLFMSVFCFAENENKIEKFSDIEEVIKENGCIYDRGLLDFFSRGKYIIILDSWNPAPYNGNLHFKYRIIAKDFIKYITIDNEKIVIDFITDFDKKDLIGFETKNCKFFFEENGNIIIYQK